MLHGAIVGDLFKSRKQTLVNTVNCVGVMGKGIALEFKKRFPEMYKDYVLRCKNDQVKLGEPYLYILSEGPWILNFPTKQHWRSFTRIKDIIRGFEYLLNNYKQWGINSIAVPPLGCGHGQLEWRIVGPTIYRYLEKMDIPYELYAPYGTPEEQLELTFLKDGKQERFDAGTQWIKPSWVALVEILDRIESQPYHWPVGRTIFQKIAFVAAEQGLPLEIVHERSSFGPFSPGLKNIKSRMLNNGLILEEPKGSMFMIKVGPTYKDARAAFDSELNKWEKIIDKTADLFMRLNASLAEIVATVMFAAKCNAETQGKIPSEKDVLDEVMQWKLRRKPPFQPEEVASTIRNLAALGWLDVTASNDLPLQAEPSF